MIRGGVLRTGQVATASCSAVEWHYQVQSRNLRDYPEVVSLTDFFARASFTGIGVPHKGPSNAPPSVAGAMRRA